MRGPMLVLMLVLAGCASAPMETQEAEAPGDVAAVGARPLDAERQTITFDEAMDLGLQHGPRIAVGIDQEVVFAGSLDASRLRECGGACHAFDVAFDVPAEYEGGWIDVRVHWDGAENPGFDLVADGQVRRGHDVSRATVWADEASVAINGTGDFAGTARYRHVDLVTVQGEFRPNLVTLTPIDLYINDCHTEERTEDGASRCLRLGNAVGNVGDGPLEVHLDMANGALAAGGLGKFVQRVYGPDGHRDVEASGADLHLYHRHFHYAGLAHFALYDFDEETGLRGGEVATGVKRGFCFLDWGDMNTPEAPSEGGQRAEQDCLFPDQTGWSMGVSRGYYDYYWPELADQYIDIAGVPDGVYELVSVADGADSLVETDETDNSASLIVEISGDTVRILEIRSLYDNPEDPSVVP